MPGYSLYPMQNETQSLINNTILLLNNGYFLNSMVYLSNLLHKNMSQPSLIYDASAPGLESDAPSVL